MAEEKNSLSDALHALAGCLDSGADRHSDEQLRVSVSGGVSGSLRQDNSHFIQKWDDLELRDAAWALLHGALLHVVS